MQVLSRESETLKMQKLYGNLSLQQQISHDFWLATNQLGGKYLVSKTLNLVIKINPDGYTPRSGLVMTDFLNKVQVYGSVYDIGTGECGILAHYAKARGAKKVVACDKDPYAVKHAAKSSNMARQISWIVGDVYSPIKNVATFNLILSNPPQMPMPERGPLHDYGGPDGRSIINEIIRECPRHLSTNGNLYLLCFDFLETKSRYGEKTSISEFAASHGLHCSIEHTSIRIIRKGGQTEQNIHWIKMFYPEYEFKKDSEGNIFHLMHILKLEHL